jgi:molybdate transport system ATP-binding protein
VSHFGVLLRHRIGTLDIDVQFEITKPWTILFGPSGSGKTTILRAIAGLLRPDFGRIVSSSGAQAPCVTLLDTAAGAYMAAHRRRIPLAAQQANLFPHKTVSMNIQYGRRASSTGGLQAEPETLELFGLTHLANHLPRQISGGEAQRVNLARAVAAAGSRLLLLDEPFTGMDATRRDTLLPLLHHELAKHGRPVLSVTHDVAEAFHLGAEVIKIAEGRLLAQGPVEVVLAEERARLLRQLQATAQPSASIGTYLSG